MQKTKIFKSYFDEFIKAKQNEANDSRVIKTKDLTIYPLGSSHVCIVKLSKPYNKIVDRMYTNDDYNLESFPLASHLFLEDKKDSDNSVLGWFARYPLEGDDILISELDDDSIIEFDELEKAYKVFVQDAKVLSDNKIVLFDLRGNILFDGKKLVAINTLNYDNTGYSSVFAHKGKAIREFMGSFNNPKMWSYYDTNVSLINDALKEELASFSGNDKFRECRSFSDMKRLVIREYGEDKIIPKKNGINIEKSSSKVKKIGEL